MTLISKLNHRILYFPIFFLVLLSFTDCAKKGTPSGGPRDTIPPKILKNNPENYTTNFDGNEIEVRFDEYIKLKDLQKELIVSPPMENNPFITPLNTSKTLKIKITDTLKPNTTYVFNFGNSITDNNEGNVFEDFKYIFSTGSYIDSLKLKGRVKDAEKINPNFPITLMLYEVDEKFTDSIVYLRKPLYITKTKDTTGIFEFTNMKEGRYKLVALEEKNKNYLFNPKEDKIGFIKEEISIPTDSLYELTLFKEQPSYKIARPSLDSKQHLIFGYEGKTDSLKIRLLNQVSKDFSSITYKDEKKDTLHYWYKPEIETDTLIFAVRHKNQIDTVKTRMRELYRDSLNISSISSNILRLKDTVSLRASVPIVEVDSEKLEIMTADSVSVEGRLLLDRKLNQAKIIFPKEREENYRILLLPGAIKDFFERENDSIRLGVRTRSSSDYGTLTLNLENVKRFPIIVQLVDEKYNVVAEDYLESLREVYFDELDPNKYFLRIIYDDNRNRKWDTGSYLESRNPEQIIYYPRKLDVRANWSLNEIFKLKS